MIEPIDVLKKAYDLITPIENFTQYVLARKDDDTVCSVKDLSATKFCAIGAIHRILPNEEDIILTLETIYLLERATYTVYNHRLVHIINDHYIKEEGHQNILELFRLAIKLG